MWHYSKPYCVCTKHKQSMNHISQEMEGLQTLHTHTKSPIAQLAFRPIPSLISYPCEETANIAHLRLQRSQYLFLLQRLYCSPVRLQETLAPSLLLHAQTQMLARLFSFRKSNYLLPDGNIWSFQDRKNVGHVTM